MCFCSIGHSSSAKRGGRKYWLKMRGMFSSWRKRVWMPTFNSNHEVSVRFHVLQSNSFLLRISYQNPVRYECWLYLDAMLNPGFKVQQLEVASRWRKKNNYANWWVVFFYGHVFVIKKSFCFLFFSLDYNQIHNKCVRLESKGVFLRNSELWHFLLGLFTVN